VERDDVAFIKASERLSESTQPLIEELGSFEHG